MTTIRITTPRLIIRSPVIEDAPAINAAILASLGSLRPWMPWAKSPPTLADTTANLAGAIARTDKDEEYRLLLFTPGGTLVGSSGLHEVDWRVPRGEIGYWIDARHAGQGYVREATAAITAFAHGTMGLRRVQIVVSDRNQRSWRIPEALGYALEAILREYRINPDGQRDHERIYACITDEPRAEEPWAGLHRRAVERTAKAHEPVRALPFVDRPIPTCSDLEQDGAAIAAAIAGAALRPDEPYAPGKAWTRRNLAWHIADTEAAMANRLCRILAEDRPNLAGIPQDAWVAQLPLRRDPLLAAGWFSATRAMVVDLIRDLPTPSWERQGVHSEFGAMRLDEVLRHLREHALHHAGQLVNPQ